MLAGTDPPNPLEVGDPPSRNMVDARWGKLSAAKRKNRRVPDMAPNRSSAFGLLDTLVVLFISSALVLFVLWLGATFAGMTILNTLPDWLSKGMSSVWTWLTTGAAGGGGALWRRFGGGAEPRGALPNYPRAIAGTTLGMICLILAVKFAFPSVPPPNSPFLLKFRVAFPDPQNLPPLSFHPTKPFGEPQGVAALSGLYVVSIGLPKPAEEYKAAVLPINQEGTYTEDLHPTPLEMCFIRALRDPASGVSHYYASVDCRLGQGCSIDPIDDPGWVTGCSGHSAWPVLPRCCIPAVYARAQPAKTQKEAGWLVPSLKTLRTLQETKKIGYTEFQIQSSPLRGLAGASYFTYDIKVNGTPVSIDGWRSSDLRATLEPTKGIGLQFGLENLNFSGADGGCETIDLRIAVFQQDKQIKTYNLFRKYAALRDAEPATITAGDGQSFQWSGNYLNPKVGERDEVFVNSTTDVTYAGRVKARIDRAGLQYEGQGLVGVLRPPLDHPSYGVIVGLRQASGQVQFMFDSARALALMRWIQEGQSVSAVKSAFPKPPFIYKTRADNAAPQFNPCKAAGLR